MNLPLIISLIVIMILLIIFPLVISYNAEKNKNKDYKSQTKK